MAGPLILAKTFAILLYFFCHVVVGTHKSNGSVRDQIWGVFFRSLPSHYFNNTKLRLVMRRRRRHCWGDKRTQQSRASFVQICWCYTFSKSIKWSVGKWTSFCVNLIMLRNLCAVRPSTAKQITNWDFILNALKIGRRNPFKWKQKPTTNKLVPNLSLRHKAPSRSHMRSAIFAFE